jgi:tocopherol O-methyltransferase
MHQLAFAHAWSVPKSHAPGKRGGLLRFTDDRLSRFATHRLRCWNHRRITRLAGYAQRRSSCVSAVEYGAPLLQTELVAQSVLSIANRASVRVPATERTINERLSWNTLSTWTQNARERLRVHPGRALSIAAITILAIATLYRFIMARRRTEYLLKRKALGLDTTPAAAGPQWRLPGDETKATESAGLAQRIATFYDLQSELWEQVWGEHMHHGFYNVDGTRDGKDDRQAQIDMMDRLLHYSGVDASIRSAIGAGHRRLRVLDVGCGIGGASRYIALRYGADVHVTGVTLSPVQASRAQVLTRQLRLEDRVETVVADALALPFPDNAFDVIWSMESAEHMPNKFRFMEECARVLRPGGILAMTAWCHRRCPPPFTDADRRIYRKVCAYYCIPFLCTLDEFENYAWQCGLVDIETADWTRATLPFWPAVARSALQRKALLGLVEGGWPVIRSALAIRWMIRGFRRNLFVIGALRAVKPAPR